MVLKVAKGLLHAYRRHQHEKEVVASIKSMDARDQRILDAFEVKNGVVPLTDGERQIKNEFWRRYFPYDFGDAYFSLTKMANAFDAHYVSDSIFFDFVLPKLNERYYEKAFSDKGVLSWWYKDVNRPLEIVKNVRGCFYSQRNELLSKEDAIRAIVTYGEEVVFKRSLQSYGGHGVAFIQGKNEDEVRRVLDEYGKDFCCQGMLAQSHDMASLNSTSLNTIRVTSLFLNGRYSALSNCIRYGGVGSKVDNVSSGGYMVGVDSNGKLGGRSYSMDGDIKEFSYDGRRLDSIKINGFEEVNGFVQKLHESLPYVPMIGWDIAIDSHNRPVLIEANIEGVGICHQQMCTGPIFGERFDEVMSYVLKKV